MAYPSFSLSLFRMDEWMDEWTVRHRVAEEGDQSWTSAGVHSPAPAVTSLHHRSQEELRTSRPRTKGQEFDDPVVLINPFILLPTKEVFLFFLFFLLISSFLFTSFPPSQSLELGTILQSTEAQQEMIAWLLSLVPH